MKAATRRLSDDHKAYLRFMKDLWQFRDDVAAGPKALYCCLLTYENLKTNECCPCQETLCHHLQTSLPSLRRWTKELIRANLIRTRMTREGKKTVLHYALFAPRPSNTGATPVKPLIQIVPFPSLSSTGSTPSTTQNCPARSMSGK
jgi:hypothetical protein